VWRFVGALNSETFFHFTAAENEPDQPTGNLVGVWQHRNERDSYDDQDEIPSLANVDDQRRVKPPQPSDIYGSIRPFLIEEYNSVMPTLDDQKALVDIYFAGLNELLPILDEESFRNSWDNGTLSPTLLQALCLVAAKECRAARHLSLKGSGLSITDFCRHLYKAIKPAINNGFEQDKLTLIRILALVSLHVDGPDEAEESSLHLMQAIHHAHTLGLHLDKESSDEPRDRLFWCLWSLDRLSACINGRPMMIHDRDIGAELRQSQYTPIKAFRIWLKIAKMVGQVIELYRPTHDATIAGAGWEDNFPTFESIVLGCEGLSLPITAIGTFYFAEYIRQLWHY
jgi:hypothetical protein